MKALHITHSKVETVDLRLFTYTAGIEAIASEYELSIAEAELMFTHFTKSGEHDSVNWMAFDDEDGTDIMFIECDSVKNIR